MLVESQVAKSGDYFKIFSHLIPICKQNKSSYFGVKLKIKRIKFWAVN